MGTEAEFQTFCSNLKVDADESIEQRFQFITLFLNQEFWSIHSDTRNSLYVGSYGRGTAIRGFNDLDMIFRLPDERYKTYNSHPDNGQMAMLMDVTEALQLIHPEAAISEDLRSVLLRFADGIAFEISPAFMGKDGSYTCPNGNLGGSWQITKPIQEINAISTMDTQCFGNLKWLCRMMRAWKNKWGISMGGLLIDSLAHRFISDWRFRDKSCLYYDWMTRDFLKFLATMPELACRRTVGSAQLFKSHGRFQEKAERCYRLADEAINMESSGYADFARDKWREVYGLAFPA